jgi:hypothetical protein
MDAAMMTPHKEKQMDKHYATPSSLARPVPTVGGANVPVYDWNTQSRGAAAQMAAGSYTSNTMQTFDSSGKVYDARGDNND